MSASTQSNDLRNRILFTLFILAVYRLGTFVPLPGIDPAQLQIMMEGNQKGLLGMFNVFAGGAVSRMAIFALGIMPYISSSIIVQLLTGNVNEPLSRVCSWLLKFYDQIISYLLFQTDLPPFPFTDIDGESSKNEVIVDSEVEEENPVKETAAEDKEETN